MFYVVTPRASFSRTRISGSLVCVICVLDRIPFFGEYDLPSILFCYVVRLQIAIGDQAPVGLAIQQLWKLRAILANSPNSILTPSSPSVCSPIRSQKNEVS